MCRHAGLSAAESQASYVMGIPFLVSAFFTPVVGLFADRFGGAATMTLASPVVLCGVHASVLAMTSMPIIPLVAQGIADQLLRRVAFRRAMKRAMQLAAGRK